MKTRSELYIKKVSDQGWILKVFDCLVFTGSGLLAYFLYLDGTPFNLYYKLGFLVAALLTITVFPLFNLYDSWRGRSFLRQFHRLILACLTVFVLLILISVVLKTTVYFSRAWFTLWGLLSVSGLVLYREVVFSILKHFRKIGWNLKSVVVIGNEDVNQKVNDRILAADWAGFRLKKSWNELAIHNENRELESDKVSALISYLEREDIQEVWITYRLNDSRLVNDLLYAVRNLPKVKVRFIPDMSDFRLLLNNSVSDIAGMVTLEFNHTAIEGINTAVKEIEDRILAFLILTFISPLMFLISIAIKLESKGPVLYKQTRHGWGGEPINVYKFRSMYCSNVPDEKFVQATKFDPRVTKVGAFLRRTSLDELPQFYNVLQGRMSIVGPRPHAVEMNIQYMALLDDYFIRNKVKPGITGWAQINGWRGETDTLEKMKRRVEHDLFYIRNWSIWLDLKIIFLTIFRGFIGKNAY